VRTRKNGGSSDVDVRTFWCNKSLLGSCGMSKFMTGHGVHVNIKLSIFIAIIAFPTFKITITRKI